ncbi:NAD(P)H-hydrate epimerase [Halobacterium rubrum]|uniref:NAD(P)H-hydrate epimerase n=1 Tax=Halobacterium TaxID=2239 RepID=UPI001F2D31F0|nr:MULTISPECIES: NAD(P)H-hydrate epimerase [Halobacterium]MDH5020287.1 NAD(P)H-hydrate epimerase [Halobacterium rubrum]
MTENSRCPDGTPRFYTESGTRVPVVTATEMRAVDRVAVEDLGLQLLQMMENAGRGLAAVVHRQSPSGAVVVAGNGGNGGGGMASARHLANHGVEVRVVLDREPASLSGAAAVQHRILDEMGVPVAVASAERSGSVLGDVDRSTLVVDSLVGYGLDGALREPAAAIVDRVNDIDASVVSLDVPSGIDATTGEQLGVAVDPDVVVTLALPKTGLASSWLHESPGADVLLLDIGIPATVFERVGVEYQSPFVGGVGDTVALSAEWES